ncbi:Protein kinase domain/Protein tyrosine kinase, putative [Leishmania donovani]|uniref:non-specific serine/threonine protein kinase n=2 Tax=Leishmania donovani TaxID=5661 RepID=A0A3S7WWM5_LEIDO|nr:Protein kinase domain/Protein tyrosine kinase, putative [Leishmania donovani]
MEPNKASSARGHYVRLGKNADVIYNEADVIGRGQFGIVYRGLIPASGTVVAVKLLQNVPMVFTPTSEHASQHSRHADRHEGKGSHPAALSSAGPSSSSFAPPSKPRSPGCPSELAILYDVRADNCPNIVHVISTWNKVLKPPRNEASGAAGAAARLVSSSSSCESRPSRIFVMVTEYCEGGDLQQFMKARGGALPAHVARSFTYQLCNALLTLKRRRIVHRDVKPANLLLTSADCEVATLKLADFGMAKAAPAPESHKAGPASASGGKDTGREARNEEDEPADAFSPLFHSEMGTPMYMSPERLALQPYGYKADVYSAGMVLLEMMRGSCVQVKWESQLRSEVPRTIWRELRQYPPDEVPAWLDLVQRMTAADPAQRYSVEDVLRHSWFHAKVGPPLPPLTFPLPETSEGGAERQPQETRLQAAATPAAGCTGSGSQSTAHAGADSLTAAAVGAPGAGGDEMAPRAPHRHNDPTVGAGGKGTSVPEPSVSSSSDDGEAGEGTQQAIKVAAPSNKHRNSRLAEPSKWMVLGVCAEVDAVHNVANGAYTGPPKPALGAQGASPVTTTVSSAVTAEAFSLPPGCGPHIITNAVRSFVDVVYLYVLQDELDAARGLTLVSYLMELMQNGYAAYLKCLEYLGCSWRHTAAMNSCTLGGHRLVVREVNALYGVWRQLMARLHGAQAAYTARLPSRILDSAAAWRQRVLGASATTGDEAAGADEDEGAPAALSVEEPRDVDVSEASTSSEGDMMMSALPSVTSISNVVADTEAAEGARVPLLAAPPAPRIAEKLRVSSVCARAEQLIFEKAVECVQSEALSMLMDSTPPPVADDLDAMDCLEEEEATMRVYRNCTTPSPPPGSEHLSTAADRSMPPHRGVALLRVLLRRAVLTTSEVGLEEEGSRSARAPVPGLSPVVASATESLSYQVPPPPLNPMSISAGSASADAVSKVVFVVKAPVFGTLDRTDLRTVENLLHAATRVFSSALSSTN